MGPKFTQKPKILQVGSAIIIECKTTSITKVTAKWYRDGVELKESAKLKYEIKSVQKDEFTITLTISVSFCCRNLIFLALTSM